MTSIVKLNSSYDLTKKKLQVVLEAIRQTIEKRVVAAYVFGSAATGDYNKDSDLDLIFVCDYFDSHIWL